MREKANIVILKGKLTPGGDIVDILIGKSEKFCVFKRNNYEFCF